MVVANMAFRGPAPAANPLVDDDVKMIPNIIAGSRLDFKHEHSASKKSVVD